MKGKAGRPWAQRVTPLGAVKTGSTASPVFSTPAEFAQYIEQSRAQVDRVAGKANLQPQ